MNQKPQRIAASTSTLPWFRLYLLCVATKYRGVLPEVEELAFLLRIKFGERRVVWHLDEVIAWIEDSKAARDPNS